MSKEVLRIMLKEDRAWKSLMPKKLRRAATVLSLPLVARGENGTEPRLDPRRRCGLTVSEVTKLRGLLQNYRRLNLEAGV
jgi:hypothetical protein